MSAISPNDGAAHQHYDALLVVSFGGPEKPDDVWPFLENVTRGKNIPHERLCEVAEHYELFDGYSPLNDQLRVMLSNLLQELNMHGPRLAVYWGNRYWHPLLADVVAQMAEDGIRSALALVTSAFGSYPGCRAYWEDIELARQNVGPAAPRIDKLRLYYNHPEFIAAWADCTRAVFQELPPERRRAARVVFTAHSLPAFMARTSPYERQLRESCRLVWWHLQQFARLKEAAGSGARQASASLLGSGWDLAFQSRSGPPGQAWLEPDVVEHLRRLHATGASDVVVVPIGFVAESMEIIYDLDVAARQVCENVGLNMVRAAAISAHPRMTKLIRTLILERLDPRVEREALGNEGPWPDACPTNCCAIAVDAD